MYCDWPKLGRCCFCMPLRRGVLTFAYINLFFNALLIGLFCYAENHDDTIILPIFSVWVRLPWKLSLVMYCIEFIFSCLLVYGAHKSSVTCLKAYYYFTITTTVAAVLLQIVELLHYNPGIAAYYIELALFAFTGLCIQLYLIILIRSLLQKLETSASHVYENQLQQFMSGDTKIEPNGIYNTTTVVPINV